MDTHRNACLTPKGREAMIRCIVDDGCSKAETARRFKITSKTVSKWLNRFRAEGAEGLRDRSSRPHSSPRQTPLATCDAAEAMRRDRKTQVHIAQALKLSTATVSRIFAVRGLSLLSAIEPKEPRPRYERKTPGEIIHIDIKKLGKFNRTGHRITGDRTGQSNGRGVGWEFAHIAIDDHSRVARIDILPDEKKESAVTCLNRTVAYFKSLGVSVTRVMTDNGSCYRSKAFAAACQALAVKHITTKPYTPQTNGKAERFVQTMLREWAYATAFETSQQRQAELPNFLHRYNWHRPHASLGKKPPFARIPVNGNNLMQLHI
jgi:transposase InsO family protein